MKKNRPNLRFKLFIILICLSYSSFAQRIDYTKLIPADSVNIPFEEKLVRLAYQNNPSFDIHKSQRTKAKASKYEAYVSGFSNVNLSYQRNNPLGSVSGNNTIFVPRTGFSIGVNLGNLLTTPSQVKMANEDIKIINFQENKDKILIRSEVLRRYRAYKLQLDLLNIHTQAVEDSRTTNQMMKKRFENGETQIDSFNSSLSAYNANLERKISTEYAVIQAKSDVEELIGVKLEDVK